MEALAKAKTSSINDQVVAITQESAKLRNSVGFNHVPDEAVEGLKNLENSLAQISELLIPFEQRFSHLEALAGIGQVINSTLEVDEVLQIVMDTIVRLMGAERGFRMLRDEH